MNNHWSQIQESGSVLGMKFMFFVYRWLGRWAFGIFLYPVIGYYFLTNSYARSSSMSFLKLVQGYDGIPSEANITYWSFKHFMQFGHSLIDKLAAWTGDIETKDLKYIGYDSFYDSVAKGVGNLLIVSHIGNQEVCRALRKDSRVVKLNVLVHTKNAEKFNKIMTDIDGGSIVNLIQVTEVTPATAMMLQEKLDAGEVVVIAGDRTPLGGGRKTQASFLGAQAYFPQGPHVLAAVLKCPVYLMFSAKGSQGYEITFEHFSDQIKINRKTREQDISRSVQKFADRLAHYAIKYPLHWNNFYDFWQLEPKRIESTKR